MNRVSAWCFSFAVIVFSVAAGKKWPGAATSISFAAGTIYGRVLCPYLFRAGQFGAEEATKPCP